MSAKIRKLPNKRRWRVRDSKGHVSAKSTSLKKAKAQVRLLNSLARN